MLLKLILLGVCVWLIYLIFRNYGKGLKNPPPPAIEENMVRCAHCGVYQPKSESIQSEGNFYCGEEHRRLHQEKK